jgi:hypothetical protein
MSYFEQQIYHFIQTHSAFGFVYFLFAQRLKGKYICQFVEHELHHYFDGRYIYNNT